jgi:hypothetical protein
MSSTKLGSRLDFSITFFNREYIMKSSCVSLNPPLPALASGVRMARVITTSSAFLEVLHALVNGGGVEFQRTYMELNPEEPGVSCLRMELSLSVAIVGL